jgi:GDP-fucose protein O-fucosyltransferase
LYHDENGTQKRSFGFADFFPLHEIARDQAGLNIISMSEFLTRTAGQLVNGRQAWPPQNRTNWDHDSRAVTQELEPWLRTVAHIPTTWNPEECLAVFADAGSEALHDTWRNFLNSSASFQDLVGHPTPVHAAPAARLQEQWRERRRLCEYDEQMQQAPVIHFTGKAEFGGRLLVHFYAFEFFMNWRQDLWTKRLVRDCVRYVDEIQCAAARVVAALRARARARHGTGEYDAFHIRRGEFQYKRTRLSAAEIYNISADLIPDGTTVFVATDERNKAFFDDLRAHFDLVFLDDFLPLLDGVNTNYFGMIDQLVVRLLESALGGELLVSPHVDSLLSGFRLLNLAGSSDAISVLLR